MVILNAIKTPRNFKFNEIESKFPEMLMPTSKRISTRCWSCILVMGSENIWDNFMEDSMRSPSLTPCRNHKRKDQVEIIFTKCGACEQLTHTDQSGLKHTNYFSVIELN